MSKLGGAPEYDEEGFRVDMGHLIAHLNRAWARRNCARPLTDEVWERFREHSSGDKNQISFDTDDIKQFNEQPSIRRLLHFVMDREVIFRATHQTRRPAFHHLCQR
jgi:hypothetical protein